MMLFFRFYTINYKRKNQRKALWFFVCEVLNLLMLLLQIYLTNKFLNGAFMLYGHKALRYVEMNVPWAAGPVTDEEYSNPQEQIFPKVTTCTFRKHGTSGIFIFLLLTYI